MNKPLVLFTLIFAGCAEQRDELFTIKVSTFDRSTKTYDRSLSKDSATEQEIKEVVESIDWVSGDTRTALTIYSRGGEPDDSRLNFQHDLKAFDVYLTAHWKLPNEDSYRMASITNPSEISRLAHAYANGVDLTDLRQWTKPGGPLTSHKIVVEQ